MIGENKKYYLLLALSYSAQPSFMAVHYSWIGKIFTYNVAHFLYIVVLKIAI